MHWWEGSRHEGYIRALQKKREALVYQAVNEIKDRDECRVMIATLTKKIEWIYYQGGEQA